MGGGFNMQSNINNINNNLEMLRSNSNQNLGKNFLINQTQRAHNRYTSSIHENKKYNFIP